MAPRQKRSWSLTGEALERLLGRLGPDHEAATGEYERLRRKLADYFDFRGSTSPDADADEVLDRVARKLEQGEAVDRVTQYAYGVAKLVILESKRRHVQEQAALDALQWQGPNQDSPVDAERRVACMEKCLGELPGESRTLIVAYCKEATASPLGGRKLLAQRLGLSYGTLKTRAHRIRARLEECLRDCLLSQGDGNR